MIIEKYIFFIPEYKKNKNILFYIFSTKNILNLQIKITQTKKTNT